MNQSTSPATAHQIYVSFLPLKRTRLRDNEAAKLRSKQTSRKNKVFCYNREELRKWRKKILVKSKQTIFRLTFKMVESLGQLFKWLNF